MCHVPCVQMTNNQTEFIIMSSNLPMLPDPGLGMQKSLMAEWLEQCLSDTECTVMIWRS